MTTSACLLLNPAAGKGHAAAVAEAALPVLHRAGIDVTVTVGDDAADAARRAAEAVANGIGALIAVGGDGMVNLALNAVAGTSTPLGIIPAGTGNDLAAMLDLPRKDPATAAAVIADKLTTGRPRLIDAGRASNRWFGCVLSAGFDSRVNDRANRMTWPRGRMRYNRAILAELRVFRPLPFTLTIDGETWETEAMLVAVGNARSYGAGMRVCPAADITDGLLDLTVLGPVGKPEFLRTFPKVYSGTHVSHPAVTTRRARRVTIATSGAPAYGGVVTAYGGVVTAYADGEYFSDLPVTAEVVPGAVHVLA